MRSDISTPAVSHQPKPSDKAADRQRFEQHMVEQGYTCNTRNQYLQAFDRFARTSQEAFPSC